jgi:hypothetical protein
LSVCFYQATVGLLEIIDVIKCLLEQLHRHGVFFLLEKLLGVFEDFIRLCVDAGLLGIGNRSSQDTASGQIEKQMSGNKKLFYELHAFNLL